MGRIFAGVGRFLAGKEAGAFFSGGKRVMGMAWGAAKSNPISNITAHTAWRSMKMFAFMNTPLILMGPGSPEEKMQSITWALGAPFLVMGMNSPWRQFGWSFALAVMPHFGSITRGIVQGYRGALESRTSLAIPFSHSTMAMDQAMSTLQYSQSRLSDSYSNLGSQAAFYSARYLSR